MKIIGDPIFTRDATGRLKSRVGTVFLRTPGMVTQNSVHALQRILWVNELNRERRAAGLPKLTDAEIDAEMAQSVDLLFDDQTVLIRPDPYAMDLAFEADELLQTLVSKRKIRFLNTHDARVRAAVCARGENWRMSRLPRASEEMNQLIANTRAAIENQPIYFYNRSTGTRFLTLDTFGWLSRLPDAAFREQLREIAKFSGMRNRFGHPEVDIFPPGCAFKRQAFEALDTEGLSNEGLRAAYAKLHAAFRQAVPEALHDESVDNLDWRNLMCSALISQPNAIVAEEIVQGFSPEFYMQIEWLPGARIENGELIFDSIFEEFDGSPNDPELHSLCDERAKNVILNYVRELSSIAFINVGRIARSLSCRPQDPNQRPNVYVVQVKEEDKPEPDVHILRFQKWCISEHLDDGQDLIGAIMEAVDYTDYILDRRLGCRQLGMNLPEKFRWGRIREVYNGTNKKYVGTRCWVIYFQRAYLRGCATDKIRPRCYASAEFNRRLARLLGEAAATNMIVGRTYSDRRVMFDDGDEVVLCGEDGLPKDLVVSDHTGTFTEYQYPLHICASAYAAPVNVRASQIPNPQEFAEIYLDAFCQRFEHVQQEYRRRKRAFDNLFRHLPVDPNGSFAYRWQCILSRLASTDAKQITASIRNHIRTPTP